MNKVTKLQLLAQALKNNIASNAVFYANDSAIYNYHRLNVIKKDLKELTKVLKKLEKYH